MRGKTVFLTGGAGAIGAATAKAFSREGARVALADLADAEPVARAIRDGGGDAYAIKLDVTDEAAVTAAVDGVVDRWGRLDIAFNNAGIAIENRATPWSSLALYDRLVDVNQRSVMLCMIAQLKHMEKQGAGSIVNNASIAGMSGGAGPGYTASKHAVIGLTRSAALRYATAGIRVNCVCPGAVLSQMTDGEWLDDESRQIIARISPMKRIGQPEEVAEGVLFLASDKASYITGHPLVIDGGYMAD